MEKIIHLKKGDAMVEDHIAKYKILFKKSQDHRRLPTGDQLFYEVTVCPLAKRSPSTTHPTERPERMVQLGE